MHLDEFKTFEDYTKTKQRESLNGVTFAFVYSFNLTLRLYFHFDLVEVRFSTRFNQLSIDVI